MALGELGVQRKGFHARVLFQVPHHQGVLHEKITFRERTVSNLCLKVPLHQIRLALKCMVGLTFMSTKTADGKQNFKTCFYFLNLEFSYLSGILQALSALHAIRGFRMPLALKVVGNEKVGGSGMCQSVPIWLGPWRSRFVCPAIRSMFFFLLYNAHCLLAHRVSLRH